MRKRKVPLAKTALLLRWLLFASLLILILSWYRKSELPPKSEIDASLLNDPIQSGASEQEFEFDYMGNTYLVTPLADYEIWGLVVSHNNTRGIADAYHDRTSVDIKDLCLIWGDNLREKIYRKVKFSSNTWTCSWRTESRAVYQKFNQEQFSNNHLLSDNAEVRKKIFDAAIGDQVHIKGLLVNYAFADNPAVSRKTSLVRDDTGNGACEVVFVDQIDLISRANQFWQRAYVVSKWGLGVCLLLIPAVFFLSARRQ